MMRRKKGSHTWDLHVHYHRCPDCGFINEDRKDFDYHAGKYSKTLTCERCESTFTDFAERQLRIGPIFGEETPAEVEWL